MVRGGSTPVVFGGHFHVTRFGMFRSRAGLALNPWSTAASPRLAYRHRPFLHTQGVIRTAPPSRSRVKNDYSLLGMLSIAEKIIPLPLVGRGRGGAQPSQRPHPVFASLRHPSPQGGGKEIPAGGVHHDVLWVVIRGLDPRICRWREMAGSSPAMTWWVSEAGSEAFAGMTMEGIGADAGFRQEGG